MATKLGCGAVMARTCCLAAALVFLAVQIEAADRCEAAWSDDGSGGVRLAVDDLQQRLCRRPLPPATAVDLAEWMARGRPPNGLALRSFEIRFGGWPTLAGDSWRVPDRDAGGWVDRWLAQHYRETLDAAVFIPAEAPCPAPWTDTCRRAVTGLRRTAQSRGSEEPAGGLCRTARPDHDARYAAGLGLRAAGDLARAASQAAAWRQALGDASRAVGWDGAVPWLFAPAEHPGGVSVAFSWSSERPGLALPVAVTTGHRLVLPAPLLWLGHWPDQWRLQDQCEWQRDAGLWGRRHETARGGVVVYVDGDDPARHLLAWRQGFGGAGERRMRLSPEDWRRLLAFSRKLQETPTIVVTGRSAPLEAWPRVRSLRHDASQAVVLVLRRGNLDPEPLVDAMGAMLGKVLADRWSGWRQRGPLERAVLLAGGLGGEGPWAGLPCGTAAVLEFTRLSPQKAEHRRRIGLICRDLWKDLLADADELEQAAAASFALEGFLLVVDRIPDGLQVTRLALPDARALAVSVVSTLRTMAPQGASGDREALADVLLGRPAQPEDATLAHELGISPDALHAARVTYTAKGEAHTLDWLRWPLGRHGPLPKTLRFAGRSWRAASEGQPIPVTAVWPEHWRPSPRLPQTEAPWSHAWQGLYRAKAGEHLVVFDAASRRGVQVLAITTNEGVNDD